MRPFSTSRLVSSAGRVLFAWLSLTAALCFGASPDPAELLQRADKIRFVDNAAFLQLIKEVEAQSDRLAPQQRDYLDYLKAWHTAYRGNYLTAVPALETVLARIQDPTLRARTRITLINVQALASHYEEAYANLRDLLESVPTLTDQKAHNLSYAVAGVLYNEAGQYDLAIKYADLWLADSSDPTAACEATQIKVEALYRYGKLHADDALIAHGLDACQRIGETLEVNMIRIYKAFALLDEGRAPDACKLLESHDAEMLNSHSGFGISRFRSALARSYLATGDLEKAREYARSAIDYNTQQPYAKGAVDSYQVLYLAAKQQGDKQGALEWHEKYAAADRGYLNDATTRTLAYQMVNQQVLDKKRQIDALNDSNRMLLLRQQVDAKSAEATRLYFVLLVAVLGSIAWWAWRTKLSQLRFQKLARRDSLTGIFNRQHFLDAATTALQYGSKSAREACLLVIDLDNFKSVNDSFGHAAGDLALKRAVSICETQLRSTDLFGRLGGEEFVILLADCDLAAAARRAEKLRAAIEGLCSGEGHIDFPVSASFGVASTARSGYNLKQLLIDADAALYQAKREGRNRVVLFQQAHAHS